MPPVELINLRLTAIGETEKPSLLPETYAGADPAAALKGTRSVYLPSAKAFGEVPVYDGFALKFGHEIVGPCVIEQVNTTTFVSPEFDVVVDSLGTYTIYLRERADGGAGPGAGCCHRRRVRSWFGGWGGGVMAATDATRAPASAETRRGLPIDRILVSILQKRLKSITEEMSIAMVRTTR